MTTAPVSSTTEGENIALSPPLLPPLVVAGMPLSGGAIVAQALFQAGLPFGDRLSSPGVTDPAGTFVDADLARLHDEMLDRIGATWSDDAVLEEIDPSVTFGERGRALVSGKVAACGVFGFREPRATLFLPAWDRSLPDARWIFPVRDPADLAWSLLRRRVFDETVRTPVVRVARGLRLWTLFHRRILDFVQSHPERCLVVAIPGDLTREGERLLDDELRVRWGYPIEPVDLVSAYNPHLLKTRRPRWVTSLARAHPSVGRLYRDLLEHGLTSRRARPPLPGPREGRDLPVVALVVPNRFRSSETFIQTHARRLPARVLLLHGQRFPRRTKDDLLISSPLERLAEAVAAEFGADTRGLKNRAFRRYLKRHRVRAVLAEYGTTGASVLEACRAAGVPLVVHFHGFDAYRDALLREYRDRYRQLFEGAASIVAVSRDMIEQLVSLGAPRERIACVPCGVDVTFFTPADPAQAPPLFVSIGRFVDKKTPHYTLLAFAEVARAHPEARLVMVGEGPLLEVCEQLARAMGLGGSVVFPGARSHAEAAALLRGARAFVQHSSRSRSGDSEGTPVAVMEAGAAGLPVVATRHAGIKDVVVHGETGFLVDEGDVRGMAGYMLELVRRPELAAALGRAARERIRGGYSQESSVARLWDVVRDARVPDGGGAQRARRNAEAHRLAGGGQ